MLADQADDDFNLGVGLYRTQRYETAAGAFDQFLKKYPEHPRANFARLYLGLSLNSIERYSEARPRFAEFLKTETAGPNVAEARYRLGECSFYLRDYEAATKQLAEFLDKHPDHKLSDWAVLLLGDARIATGQHRSAADILRRIAPEKTGSPVFADALFSLGKALEGTGDLNAAIQSFRAAAELPNQQIAQRALTKVASIEYGRGNFQQALEAWQKLQSSGNTALLPAARLGAGMALYRLSQFPQAIEQLQAVPETAPAAAQARLFTGMSQLQLKQPDQARTSLDLALQLAADTPLAVEVTFQKARLEQELAMPAVDDSPSSQLLLEQAADQARANPREAVRLLVQALDAGPGLVVRSPRDPDLFVTVGARVHAMLAADPALREAYRKEVGPDADAQLAR
ncbi:MAG: tetratricopeptide repeat protein, partial [Planctomyces sp.]